MRYGKLKLCAVFLLGLGFHGSYAQESTNTIGGNASGSGGSASYSVGQVVYQTYVGTSVSASEGVQQPYEILVVTGLEEANGIALAISAYPNPAIHAITLEIKDHELSSLNFQLYDMQGGILQSGKIVGNQTRITMGNLLPATYFLAVYQENKELKTFKNIKN